MTLKDDEFERECLQPGRVRPIPTVVEREREAANFHGLSAKKLRAAQLLLGTDAEQMAVADAAMAMEFKANELLALVGFRSKSHVCTQAALSKVLARRDLAFTLTAAYHDRLAYDYTNDPGAMESAKTVSDFVGAAEGYIARVEDAIRSLRR